MPVPIQKCRELELQLLYSYDIISPDEEDMISFMMRELSLTKKTVKEALEKIHKILEKKPEIDAMIAKTSTSYALERIQKVELNILRLAIYEIIYSAITPPKVMIAEAIRLSRKFGTPESGSFVNAILDSIYKLQPTNHD
jgi:transcription antitermination protein NusB